MLTFKYYEGQIEDVDFVICNHREGDVVDEDATELHIENSDELWLCYEDDFPIAVFGISSKYPRCGYDRIIYFIGTPDVDRYKKTLVKQARRIVNFWGQKYKRLYMMAVDSYEGAHRLARALGFRKGPEEGRLDMRMMYVKEWG